MPNYLWVVLHPDKFHNKFDIVEAWRKHTLYSLDGTETKLLVYSSKPRIHEGFPWIHKKENWNPPEKEFDKSLCLLIII